MPLTCLGEDMPYGEAVRLTGVLLADTSSAVWAAVADVEAPVSSEARVLMDLYDLHAASVQWRRKPKPYPRPKKRPKPVTPERRRRINATLRALGHGPLLDEIERRRV